jgi:hypothetical protein
MSNANQMKKELKEAGINTKNIRIRVKAYSVHCEVSDLSIKISDVEAVLKSKYESISRCEYTGEVLQGGNTFVSVSYDWDALKKAEQDYNLVKELAALTKEFCENFPIYHAAKIAAERIQNESYTSEVVQRVARSFYDRHRQELKLSAHL